MYYYVDRSIFEYPFQVAALLKSGAASIRTRRLLKETCPVSQSCLPMLQLLRLRAAFHCKTLGRRNVFLKKCENISLVVEVGWCAVGRHGGRELRMYVGRYVGRYVGSVPRFSVPYTKTNTDILK